MPLIELGMITGAIVEMAVEVGWNKLRKHQAVQQVLRNLGIDFDPASADFRTIYVYTLVLWGLGKPQPVIEIFNQPRIYQLIQRAFETGDPSLVEREARDSIDWPVLERVVSGLDVSPEPLIREFVDCFDDVVSRVRTVVEIRHERKIDQLVRGQELIAQQISHFSLQFKETEVLLSQASSLEDTQLERLSQERTYDAQIDQARDLIQEDRAGAAQSLLKKLEVEFQDRDVSAGLRFRLLTNLGAIFLVLGEDAQAVPYFERALDYAPDDPKAVSNVALAALIQDDFERAINLAEQALEIQSDYPPALSVWIQALSRARRFDQLDQERRTAIERDVESRRALALVLLDAKEYEQAEELLRLSVESGESEPQDLALLAQAIMAPIQIAWQGNPPLPWSTPADEIARLEEAESLLTEVINAWALIENRRRFHSALGLRVHARAMQSKFELAREDCQRILGEDPAHPLALYHSGLLALQTRDFAEAIKYLEQSLANPLQQESTHIPLAVAYLLNGQPRDVLRILLRDRSDEREQPMPVYVEELGLIAQAAQMLGETGQVAGIVEQLCALPKDDPLVLKALASVDLIQGNIDNAIEYLQQALGLARGHLKNYITLQLADVYHRQRQFDKAIPLYETVVPADVDSPPTRNYVVSLLNSGDWKQAYDLAVRIRNDGDAIPVISEVEARISEYIGDLEPALHLYMELAKLEPDNPEHFLRVASVYIRLGKSEEAANFLAPVVKCFWDDPHTLINAARVFANAGRPASDVLSLAYRARRLEMDRPETHLSYIGLFMRPETKNDPSLDLDPSEVGVGSSVQLTSEREVKWYTILGEEPVDRGKWQVLQSDSVAQKLLEHGVGETIQLKKGPYEQLAYKITEIQSKYVRAFQETLVNFGTWFPDHPGLHRFEIVDNDISPIFRMTEMPHRWHTEMHNLYASRQLTLEGFAQSIGRGIAAVWGGNMTGGNQLIASVGTHQEQKYHHRILESSTGVTVDLMALFTLKYLNQLSVLTDRFQQVYVAQASIDVLIEDVQMLRQFDQEHGSIGREGERYTLTTIPKEVTAHNIQFVEQILAFAQENCQVMPVARALELGRERFEQTEFVLGRSSIASVLVAEETDTLLYSDDFLLRTVAQHDFSVAGVWTQPVLSSTRDQGILKEEEYCDSVAALVLANYSYVPLNIPVLIHVLRKNQWGVNPMVERVFAPLSAKTITSDAVNIVADLIEQVWAEPVPVYQKQHIIDLCLRTLATDRDSELIVHMLQSALQQRFPLVEHQLQQVTNEIVRWLKVHRSLGV